MNALVKITVAVLSVAAVTACGGGGGGGGGGSTGGGCSIGCGGGTSGGGGTTVLTHAQLADKFIEYAWTDAGIDATIVKTNTLQSNYIVVYDYDLDTYDAYWLGGFSPSMDVYDYITANNNRMYYDLDYNGNNVYEDYYTGIQFEETSATSKDLEKVAAITQGLRIVKSAKALKAEFGLSEERAVEVARMAAKLATAPKGSMTDKDYDAFSKELTGASISQFKSALDKSVKGNATDMNSLVDQAAKINGVGPEHMNKIISNILQQN
jgi:hypothetical protein